MLTIPVAMLLSFVVGFVFMLVGSTTSSYKPSLSPVSLGCFGGAIFGVFGGFIAGMLALLVFGPFTPVYTQVDVIERPLVQIPDLPGNYVLREESNLQTIASFYAVEDGYGWLYRTDDFVIVESSFATAHVQELVHTRWHCFQKNDWRYWFTMCAAEESFPSNSTFIVYVPAGTVFSQETVELNYSTVPIN